MKKIGSGTVDGKILRECDAHVEDAEPGAEKTAGRECGASRKSNKNRRSRIAIARSKSRMRIRFTYRISRWVMVRNSTRWAAT